MSDDEIGYKKPPKSGQFKSGLSGNPRGRPRKNAKSLIECFERELERPIKINEDGVIKYVLKKDLIARQLVTAAVKGDRHSIKRCFDLDKGIVRPIKTKRKIAKPKTIEEAQELIQKILKGNY